MTDLIKRLEEATGPCREHNWLIAEHFGDIPQHTVIEIGWDYDWYRRPGGFSLWRAKDSEGRSTDLWQPNPYTASIDAAVALAELVMPGHQTGYLSSFYPDAAYAGITSEKGKPTDLLKSIIVGGATPALALCIAILKAKEAGDAQ